MRVVIARKYNTKETLGSWHIFDGYDILYSCKTIELPWKENQHNISCIPEGKYLVKRIVSPTKGLCFHVQDVSDRDSILIHSGNFVYGKQVDSLGCILVGSDFKDLNNDGHLDVIQSKLTLQKLLDILIHDFYLYII